MICRESDGDSFENMRSMNQDLTFSYVTRAFEQRHLDLGRPQMITLGMMTAENIYTNLGLLLSDQCPHIIKAAVFSGEDQLTFRNRYEFSGSLLKQADDAYAFLDMLNETSSTFEGLYRIDRRAYPESALREALLNAIVHRDYSISASTLISAFDNRVEIVSAGGLIGGFSLPDVIVGFSVCRNPGLANIFYRLELIEAYGIGLRKIITAYPSLSPENLLQTTGHVFKVTLPRITSTPVPAKAPSLRESPDDMILSFLRTSEKISRADVEKITGLSTASSARLLKKLVDEDRLEISGSGRNTRYLLKK